MIMQDSIKYAIQYNRILHDSAASGPYKPNGEWDEFTTTVYSLLQENLPANSLNMTLADVGSGAGKWTALLSSYWKKIESIEPHQATHQLLAKFVDCLRLPNVELRTGMMPECLTSIKTDATLLLGSLYLVKDWMGAYKLILESSQWFAICDGPDTDSKPINNDGFDHPLNHPADNITGRLPLLAGVEWELVQLAEQAGYNVKVYNIKQLLPNFETGQHWLIIGDKTHA